MSITPNDYIPVADLSMAALEAILDLNLGRTLDGVRDAHVLAVHAEYARRIREARVSAALKAFDSGPTDADSAVLAELRRMAAE